VVRKEVHQSIIDRRDM